MDNRSFVALCIGFFIILVLIMFASVKESTYLSYSAAKGEIVETKGKIEAFYDRPSPSRYGGGCHITFSYEVDGAIYFSDTYSLQEHLSFHWCKKNLKVDESVVVNYIPENPEMAFVLGKDGRANLYILAIIFVLFLIAIIIEGILIYRIYREKMKTSKGANNQN